MRRAAGLRPLVFRIVRLVFAAAVVGILVFLPFAGRFLDARDPLQHADLIMVLGGARIERWLEAVDLYKEGWAPAIVMSPGSVVPLEVAAARAASVIRARAIWRATRSWRSVSPPDAVTVLPGGVDNTAAGGRRAAAHLPTRHRSAASSW